MTFISTLLRALIGFAVLTVAYEAFAQSAHNPIFFPSLRAMVSRLGELAANPDYWRHIGTSLFALGQGFLPAVVVGVVAGLAFSTRAMRWVVAPFVLVLAAVPMVVFLPLVILWQGLGPRTHILVVFMFSAFTIARSVMIGSVAASSLPNAVTPSSDPAAPPQPAPRRPAGALGIVEGLRWGLLMAVTGLLVSEMVAANAGIGYFIMQSMATLDSTATLAGCLTVALPAMLAIVVLDAIAAQLAASASRPVIINKAGGP